MSAETTTIHITEAIRAAARYTARPPRYRGRRRHANTDVRAVWGIVACLAVGVPAAGLEGYRVVQALAHLAGVW